MTTSAAFTVKSPLPMPAYSSPKASTTALRWLAHAGRVLRHALLRGGEAQARATLRSRNFY